MSERKENDGDKDNKKDREQYSKKGREQGNKLDEGKIVEDRKPRNIEWNFTLGDCDNEVK